MKTRSITEIATGQPSQKLPEEVKFEYYEVEGKLIKKMADDISGTKQAGFTLIGGYDIVGEGYEKIYHCLRGSTIKLGEYGRNGSIIQIIGTPEQRTSCYTNLTNYLNTHNPASQITKIKVGEKIE